MKDNRAKRFLSGTGMNSPTSQHYPDRLVENNRQSISKNQTQSEMNIVSPKTTNDNEKGRLNIASKTMYKQAGVTPMRARPAGKQSP